MLDALNAALDSAGLMLQRWRGVHEELEGLLAEARLHGP